MTEKNIQTDFDQARSATGVLLPYQARWVADQSTVKVMEKSRRVGISWAEAADDTLWASETGQGEKRNVWYIGYNKDMAQEFIRDCANWGRAYNLAASEMEEYDEIDQEEIDGVIQEKKIRSFRITLQSGWTITALSSRPTNLRGKQGRLILDEAAFHDDLAGLIKAAMALLIWGGTVRIISTHFGDSNAFNELVQDIRKGKRNYSLHRVDFDEALADGLYRRICEVLHREWSPEGEAKWRQDVIDSYGEDADEELFCIPSQGTGTWLTRALIEQCMSAEIPVVRYEQTRAFAELPDSVREAEVKDWCEENLKPLLKGLEGRASYFGEDFGRTGDLSVILPLIEQQSATFRAPFIVELRNVPFRQQEQILFYIADRLPRFRYGALDARGNGQYLAERAMQRYGASRIAEVMLTEPWYRDNMPRYKSAFEDKTVLLAKDADIIEDHRAVKVIRGVARLPEVKGKGRDNKQRHGDAAIAGALAWFATNESAAEPTEYETVQTRRFPAQAGAW
jgi:phage FluMu gp28-like protein